MERGGSGCWSRWRRCGVLVVALTLGTACSSSRELTSSASDRPEPATDEAASGGAPPEALDDPAPEDDRLGVVRDHLDNPLGGEQSREVADALQGDVLLLRDGGRIDVAAGVPWEGWEAETSTAELRLLHSLLFVHDLVETGRPEDLALAHALVEDWAERNPWGSAVSDMAWHDETTARRATALIRLHDALERLDEVGALAGRDLERHEELEVAIVAHLELLLDDDFHTTGTNHGMFQDRAALLAAGYLDVRGRGSELTQVGWGIARERLVDYYRSTVSADGVHLEHAPAYHQLIAASAEREAELLQVFGDEAGAEKLLALHAAMVTYATHVVQPDGTWPLVSDTFTRDRPRVGLWDDPGYRYAATGGHEGAPPSRTAIAFEDAGYLISRDRWTDDGTGTYLHFTAAYHGDYHKHADDLSVWLYHDGPLLTELGPQGYTMTDPLVRCAFSEDAHNIATVAGMELPRTDEQVGRTRLTDADVGGAVRTATGVNERLDGVRFERSVLHDTQAGAVEVVDLVTTEVDRAVRVRWHLDPSVTATVDGDVVELAREGLEPVVGTVSVDGPSTLRVIGPDPDACAGLRFGGGEPEPTSTLEITTPPRSRSEVAVRFELP